jgi:hypothetical protein
MTTFYEVWDDDSNNRVGGPFETQAEAEALLNDVMRVSGPDVARDMAVILWRERPAGGYDAATVLEGADFLKRRGGDDDNGGNRSPRSGGASGAQIAAAAAAGMRPADFVPGFLGAAEQIAKAMPRPSYESPMRGALQGIDARTLGITGATDMLKAAGPFTDVTGLVSITALYGELRPSALLGELQTLKAAASMSQLQLEGLGSVQAQIREMIASTRDAYITSGSELSAIMSPLQEGLRHGLLAQFSALQECASCFDLTGVRSLAESLATFRDKCPPTLQASIASSYRAFFDEQARALLDINAEEFVERYEAGELPADDPDEKKNATTLVAMMPILRRAA